MEQHNILLAFLFTVFAGLSTVLGALFVFFFKKSQESKFLSLGLGFSAGIMLYLSFFDLLKEARLELIESGATNITLSVALFFVGGFVLAGIIDLFTHKYMVSCVNMESGCAVNNKKYKGTHGRLLFKTGVFAMIALALHNFPEGIATFGATTVNTIFGFSIALAIAIHNIPEGFCIAMPIFHSTHSYKKSIFYTLLAGLAEPLGAVIAFLFLYPFMTEYMMGGILALVAGIMVYVAIDSLLPIAKRLGQWHTALGSMVVGMVVMLVLLHYIV